MTCELETRGIVKRFSNLVANDHIDIAIEQGEIRAIVGENGAGKTTLMNILYGLYQPDEGEIFIRGQRVEFHSPSDSIHAGLGMVHQQFMLFPSLTVAENVIYGSEPSRHGLINQNAAYDKIREISNQYGLNVDPTLQVSRLPLGVRQRVEILKALYREASILILDEPTAVLTPQERDGLFKILHNLSEQGKTILFITHKLNEVMAVSDKTTVLRNGRVTAELHTKDTNQKEITKYMIGRNVMLQVNKPQFHAGDTVLELENVVVKNEFGKELIDELSFKVKGGEILGIAGVSGNGQQELVEVIMGLRPLDGGHIHLKGQEISKISITERRKAISFIPEDRVGIGSAIDANVSENLIMGSQSNAFISRNGILQRKNIAEFVHSLIDRFKIKISQLTAPLSHLSGGNLQKVVVARELTFGCPLLIADQPTRGLDVGSIEFIYKQLIDYRSQNKAILLISADLNEVMILSDRILVMYEGQISGEVEGVGAREETLGLMMTGSWKQQ